MLRDHADAHRGCLDAAANHLPASPLALRSSLLARAKVFHKPADLPLGAKPRTRNTKTRAPGPVYNVSVADYHTDIVGSPSGASPFDRTIRGCRAGPVAGKSLQELLP